MIPGKPVGSIYTVWIAICWVVVCGVRVSADDIDPVSSGASALRGTRSPWYDSEQDDVRVVSPKKESTASERQNWQGDGPKRPEWKWDWDWDWWGWGSGAGSGGAGNFRIPSFGEILQFIGWALLFALLIGLIYVLVRTFLNLEQAEESLVGSKKQDELARTDEQRIRDLPIQPTIKKGDFLSMARDAYETEQYAEAIVYLFSHRLIQLDRAGFIRLTRGKTNRQYLFEISRSRPMCEILGQTILCFEDVFFGKHDLSKDRFEQTWQDNVAFDRIIQESTARS